MVETNSTIRKKYILVGEKLWIVGPGEALLEDVTEQHRGKCIDPVILASVLRNLGREMTLTNWHWRMAYYLTERLDVKVRDAPRPIPTQEEG